MSNSYTIMCAYCTGQIGDCGVGIEEQAVFDEKYGDEFRDGLYELIDQRPDEHGTHRPCGIESTPGYYNNGHGKHSEVEEGKKAPEDSYPAYQSVGIYFQSKPTQEMIDMIKERAAEFVTQKSKRFSNEQRKMKILGFRMVREITTTETEDL
jgi:hypothetical protein